MNFAKEDKIYLESLCNHTSELEPLFVLAYREPSQRKERIASIHTDRRDARQERHNLSEYETAIYKLGGEIVRIQ